MGESKCCQGRGKKNIIKKPALEKWTLVFCFVVHILVVYKFVLMKDSRKPEKKDDNMKQNWWTCVSIYIRK